MSHRNSKKSNRIGQSIQKHRAQRNSPYVAEAQAAMEREYRNSLPSPSELSNLKSEIVSLPPSDSAPSAPLPLDPSDPPPSTLPLCHSTTMPLSPPSELSTQNSALLSPATKAMHKLQSILDSHDFDYLNPNDVAQLSALLVVYAQLQNSAAVERITESLDQVGAGYKREPLTRELTKVLAIQDRALARSLREKAAKERDQRRIERELKREQAQAAKQARDERLFNQREDHMTRKEKIATLKYETALLQQTNSQRQQTDKHRKSHGAMQRGTGTPAGVGSDSSSALGTQHSALSPTQHSELS